MLIWMEYIATWCCLYTNMLQLATVPIYYTAIPNCSGTSCCTGFSSTATQFISLTLTPNSYTYDQNQPQYFAGNEVVYTAIFQLIEYYAS